MKDLTMKKTKTGRPLSFDRDEGLRKAMLTFWRYGYETTSLHDLTSAMGVTPPSIYTAYGDKKQLFIEAARLYAGSPDDLELSLFAFPTAREAAEDMLIRSADAFTGDLTPKGCLLASATASGSKGSAEVQSTITAIRQDIQSRLRKRIEADVASGLMPDDTDSASLSGLIIAVIQGMSVLARDGADRNALIGLCHAAMAGWPSPPLSLSR